MKFKLNNQGVSLALTIGLLLLLVALTMFLNELVIRALRAAHTIEAADRAYLAAEAGIEDALYELSTHNAGYQTPSLSDGGVRQDDFDSSLNWKNHWAIASQDLNDCSAMDPWATSYTPNFCGRIYEDEKLVINLFRDDATNTGPVANEINVASTIINTLDITGLTIKIRLPVALSTAHMTAFTGVPHLKIDNDGDYIPGSGGCNEDSSTAPTNPCPYSLGVSVSDNDCDGWEDEDGPETPVFLWKLVDDAGHSFQPLKGCILDANHPSHPSQTNSYICESSFIPHGFEISAYFDESDYGFDETGTILPLATFLSNLGATGTSVLQMEILPTAPFEFINLTTQERVHIPYFEYGIKYSASGDVLPSTYFSIQSDGYYRDFKQSITTNVVPRATTKLLDLTILQQ